MKDYPWVQADRTPEIDAMANFIGEAQAELDHTLPKSLKPFQSFIESYSDERDTGDGVWVYLLPGYVFLDEMTTIHEDTLAEVASDFRNGKVFKKGAK